MRIPSFAYNRFLAAAIAAALVLAGFPVSRAAASPRRPAPTLHSATPVIVDTDAGIDDLLALAFLLGRRDVHIEAITVVNGLCHVSSGANNVLRLLQLAGHPEIPVYEGATAPLAGHAAFPESWRKDADTLPGVTLPATTAKPQAQSASSFLMRRLADSKRPVRILALGPLTNLAAVLRVESWGVQPIQEIVIMGGALNVPGNLGDGGYFKTDNKTAEWNFYMDPLAASIVFSSSAPIRLIPLDATQQVPIKSEFLDKLTADAKTPLEKFAAEVLGVQKKLIAEGVYFAWDPLAAVALADPTAVSTIPMNISITEYGTDTGRSVSIPGKAPNAQVATSANADLFRREFLEALATPTPAPPPTPTPAPAAAPPKAPALTPKPAPAAAPAAPPKASSPPANAAPASQPAPSQPPKR
jgi:pyrimidine-specific ribonucleoside hydrolase